MIYRKLLNLMVEDDYTFWEKILKGKDLPYEFLNFLSENVADKRGIKNVRLGLQKGLKTEMIKLYTNTSSYSEFQIPKILDGLEYCKENESKLELVKLYLNPRLSYGRMSIVLDGIRNGLNKKEILLLCDTTISDSVAESFYNNFLKSRRSDNLYELISSYNETVQE